VSVLAQSDDPDGRRVVLDREGWDHILEGHGVMAAHQGAIMATVESPDHRVPDPIFPERERLYRRGLGPSSWVFVVVDRGQEPARVVTAYPLRKGPS
jgi:hypothetical protein